MKPALGLNSHQDYRSPANRSGHKYATQYISATNHEVPTIFPLSWHRCFCQRRFVASTVLPAFFWLKNGYPDYPGGIHGIQKMSPEGLSDSNN